ncbi:MAG: ATP-binding protein [Polyangiaceae bacterium]
MITDITARLEAERAEREARELQAIIGNILRDPFDFEHFLQESEAILVELLDRRQEDEKKRLLHTLKGNTAVFGFIGFSEECHTLEDAVAEDDCALDRDAIQRLRASWEASIARVLRYAPTSDSPRIVLPVDEYKTFLDLIEGHVDHSRLGEEARRWILQPASRLFARLVEQGKRLAKRQGKEIDVQIIDHGIRLAPEPMRKLVSALSHALRNSIDHGIELPEERRQLGKVLPARISVDVTSSGDRLTIAFRDDGRGIDWERIRQRATERGLHAGSESELAEVLFTDGFSTRDAVTTTSGRGVGLSALREVARSLGGDATIRANADGVGAEVLCNVSMLEVTKVSLAQIASTPTIRPLARLAKAV